MQVIDCEPLLKSGSNAQNGQLCVSNLKRLLSVKAFNLQYVLHLKLCNIQSEDRPFLLFVNFFASVPQIAVVRDIMFSGCLFILPSVIFV